MNLSCCLLTIHRCLLIVSRSIVDFDLALYQIINMEKNIKVTKFGEEVEGFTIPVLNEREIRAAAGILFLLMFISVLYVIFKGNFILLKYAVIFFLTDILIRVFITPRFSPTLILGRLIVRRQTPEYVGAAQKKFAWSIGVVIAATMFILLVVMNSYSPITGLLCFVCLIFLFFETAFGICIGCAFYPLFHKEKALYCPGEVCGVKTREKIQKTSVTQMLILIGFIAFILITVRLFGEDIGKSPAALFEKAGTAQSE